MDVDPKVLHVEGFFQSLPPALAATVIELVFDCVYVCVSVCKHSHG